MKLFFDFVPIFVFFIAYKFFGIFVATTVAILCSFIQLAFYWFKFRRIETMTLVSCIIITVLGGFTLLLHNVMFIKWKPTILYFVFALALLLSGFFTKQSLLQRMLGKTLKLPAALWKRLNYIWVSFFMLLAALNLYVVYNFSTSTWVNFKLFGIMGLTLLFLLAQGIYIAKFIDASNINKSNEL
jgi:intracellular septation protein